MDAKRLCVSWDNLSNLWPHFFSDPDTFVGLQTDSLSSGGCVERVLEIKSAQQV